MMTLKRTLGLRLQMETVYCGTGVIYGPLVRAVLVLDEDSTNSWGTTYSREAAFDCQDLVKARSKVEAERLSANC